MVTYTQGVALLLVQLTSQGPLFLAVPPERGSDQRDWRGIGPNTIAELYAEVPDTNPTESGSNGWAIAQTYASGQGFLTPHFPRVISIFGGSVKFRAK